MFHLTIVINARMSCLLKYCSAYVKMKTTDQYVLYLYIVERFGLFRSYLQQLYKLFASLSFI